MEFTPIFTELKFRNLKVKNRIFRSNISGRFDNYDGSGNPVRINWEESFAKGGVGAIISSFVPVLLAGRIMPNYATVDADDKIPFWRAVGEAVHRHDCRFIMQLSHSGRQQDIPGVENQFRSAGTSGDRVESFHGLVSHPMTKKEIAEVVAAFAQGARRAREAGLDGVELHGANGYLITQFLSSGINNRKDEYGGPLENRARFLLEIIRAIRSEVGKDFHLQVKFSAIDYNNALFPWEKPGNTLEDGKQIARWVVQAGADALHVSSGSMFPHPRNPMGDFPLRTASRNYDIMLSSGTYTFRNFLFFQVPGLKTLFKYLWHRMQEDPEHIEGNNAPTAREIRKVVREITTDVPVIVTGGFQTAQVICDHLERGDCDAVSIARTLIANRDMVNTYFRKGQEIPAKKRCTYCNKCLINDIENPLGCYEVARYDSYDEMIKETMSVFRGIPLT
jgi:2,4-dienoyl-CoA reductase-like NADH-dependent reductase (Old Yellow Enzyme family)